MHFAGLTLEHFNRSKSLPSAYLKRLASELLLISFRWIAPSDTAFDLVAKQYVIRGWWGGRIGHSSIGELLLDTPLLIALRSPDLLFGEYRSKQR